MFWRPSFSYKFHSYLPKCNLVNRSRSVRKSEPDSMESQSQRDRDIIQLRRILFFFFLGEGQILVQDSTKNLPFFGPSMSFTNNRGKIIQYGLRKFNPTTTLHGPIFPSSCSALSKTGSRTDKTETATAETRRQGKLTETDDCKDSLQKAQS